MNEKDEFENVGWTHIVCKNCGKMFAWFDLKMEMNDMPKDDFYYCPTCQRKGFKNKLTFNTKQKKHPYAINLFFKTKNITDKIVKKTFKKMVENYTGKNMSYDRLLKEALEIRSYYTDEEVKNFKG